MTGDSLQSENSRLTRRMNAFMITIRILNMARARGVCETLRMNGKMYENAYPSIVYGNREMESI